MAVWKQLIGKSSLSLFGLVREDFTTGLHTIVDRLGGEKVGAVLALRVWPGRAEKAHLLDVLEQSKDILVEGGVVVFGVDGHKREDLEETAREGVDGYNMRVVFHEDIANDALGDVMLAAKRLV